MKRLLAVFWLLALIALQACAVATTVPETYRYIVYNDLVFMEIDEGFFRRQDDTIHVAFLDGRTVYRPTFSEAVVTVATDGSLSAVYSDGWTAECLPDALADACDVTSADTVRQTELNSLLGFRDAAVQEGEYAPTDYDPPATAMSARLAIVIAFLTLILGYRLLVIFLPRGSRGRLFPSATFQIHRSIMAGRGQGGVRGTWVRADAVLGNIKDDMEDRYGPRPQRTDTVPKPTLAERFRSQWVQLLVTLVVVALGIWWMLTW